MKDHGSTTLDNAENKHKADIGAALRVYEDYIRKRNKLILEQNPEPGIYRKILMVFARDELAVTSALDTLKMPCDEPSREMQLVRVKAYVKDMIEIDLIGDDTPRNCGLTKDHLIQLGEEFNIDNADEFSLDDAKCEILLGRIIATQQMDFDVVQILQAVGTQACATIFCSIPSAFFKSESAKTMMRTDELSAPILPAMGDKS